MRGSSSREAADDPRLSPRNHRGLRTESGLSDWGRRAPAAELAPHPLGTVVVSIINNKVPRRHQHGRRSATGLLAAEPAVSALGVGRSRGTSARTSRYCLSSSVGCMRGTPTESRRTRPPSRLFPAGGDVDALVVQALTSTLLWYRRFASRQRTCLALRSSRVVERQTSLAPASRLLIAGRRQRRSRSSGVERHPPLNPYRGLSP